MRSFASPDGLVAIEDGVGCILGQYTEGKAMEFLDFECPHCRRVLKIPTEYLGKKGTCNKCGKKIMVRITAAFPKSKRKVPKETSS